MKRIGAFAVAAVCLLSFLLTSCISVKGTVSALEKYTGSYDLRSSGLLMYNTDDGGDGRIRDCILTLMSDGTGTLIEGNDAVDLKWHAPDKETKDWMRSFEDIGLKMEIQIDEVSGFSAIGTSKNYVGYLADKSTLVLFDGPADDGFTCRYNFNTSA